MHPLYKISDTCFDYLEAKWESTRGQKVLGSTLVLGFVISLAVIECNRLGWIPNPTGKHIPVKHLIAIESAFLLLLIYEVISLIFSLARSTSTSVGKQFEVLSLFLLRDTFKTFSHFQEPLSWDQIEPVIIPIMATNIGALAIFIILIFYYKIQKHFPITKDSTDRRYFILAKKILSLLLLISFIYIIGHNFYSYIRFGHGESAFETFYTILIFSDVLIVLLSMRYSANYQVAFRNSGFAVSTVMIRISLIAPLLISSLIGVGAALFALGILWAYNYSISAKTNHSVK